MDHTRETAHDDRQGIPIRIINITMVVIACILSVFLIIFAYQTTRSYISTQTVTEQYIACQQDASSLIDGSDYLTEMARQYVISGDPEYAYRYFEEVERTRRRETAVEDLGRYFAGTDAYSYLEAALDRSNTLMETECAAMRLVAESRGYKIADYPAGIRDVTLSPAYAALSPEAMQQTATELMFGNAYQTQKDGIRADVSHCLDILINEVKNQQKSSSDRFLATLGRQSLLITILLLCVLAVIFLTFRLVIQPLTQSVSHIQDYEMIPLRGSAEMQFLAKTYNRIFEQSQKHQEQLSYEASHDDLTGLNNRGVFEEMRATLDPGHIALILADVDYFKQINDTYGHEIGDRILRKTAALLLSSFRSEDYVCRIGGDEFAILMMNSDSSLRNLVTRKIEDAQAQLRQPEDGVPGITLSVGVAFPDRPNSTGDIYRDADTAQYRIKNGGKDGLAFYD